MTHPPKPTPDVVRSYLDRWKSDDSMRKSMTQETALDALYAHFDGNTNLNSVLLKVAALNDFYSTNVFDTYPVAVHILSLKDVDQRLRDSDPNLLDDIANVPATSGRRRRLFSFSTKYCSRHHPDKFPIYDSMVRRMLAHYRDHNVDGPFRRFRDKDLTQGQAFRQVITDFITFYRLNDFSFKQLDMFLWLCGKQFFPRSKI